MKSRTAPAIAAIVLGLGIRPSAAQPASAPPVSSKEAKIRELLELTGEAKLGAQVVTEMFGSFRKSLPDVPAEFWDEFQKDIHPEDLEELIVPIYGKHFQESEIQGLLDFYRTPLGKKVIQELPAITSESFSAGQQWGRGLAEKAIKRLKEKGYKLKA